MCEGADTDVDILDVDPDFVPSCLEIVDLVLVETIDGFDIR